MPKQVKARAGQDTQEERLAHKLARSHHAPADWKFHGTGMTLMRSDNWGDFSMRPTCYSSIHSSLGYLTPVEFEQQWRLLQASQQEFV